MFGAVRTVPGGCGGQVGGTPLPSPEGGDSAQEACSLPVPSADTTPTREHV